MSPSGPRRMRLKPPHAASNYRSERSLRSVLLKTRAGCQSLDLGIRAVEGGVARGKVGKWVHLMRMG